MYFFTRSTFHPFVFGLLVVSGAVQAQALLPGVRLGMTADELHAAVPAAERIARPQRLGRGLAGTWRGAPVLIVGLTFEPTFFFAGPSLQRVEFVASAQGTADSGTEAFTELVAWGRSRFGSELASSDPGSAYATWVQGDADVYVQHVGDPQRASVRLVYKVRQVKDGSAL